MEPVLLPAFCRSPAPPPVPPVNPYAALRHDLSELHSALLELEAVQLIALP